MRFGLAALAGLCGVMLTGCGYMGQPLPPALKRPVRVVDLTAVERGKNIVIQFTVPKETTEGLPIERQDIELWVGPADSPFQEALWKKTADRLMVPGGDSPIARVERPAAKWYNQTLVIGLEAYGPHHRSAGLSNLKILPVVAALPTPEGLEARNAPDAVRLDWHAAAPGFRVLRKLEGDPNWAQIATTTKPEYTDTKIEYGKTYEYQVQSIQQTSESDYAESELSQQLNFKPKDEFAPAVPAGLFAVPGTRNIDLAWERNTEKDFAGYNIYRDGTKVASGIAAPAYSDRDVKQGVTYRYQISAVDTGGNESGKSAVVESKLP